MIPSRLSPTASSTSSANFASGVWRRACASCRTALKSRETIRSRAASVASPVDGVLWRPFRATWAKDRRLSTCAVPSGSRARLLSVGSERVASLCPAICFAPVCRATSGGKSSSGSLARPFALAAPEVAVGCAPRRLATLSVFCFRTAALASAWVEADLARCLHTFRSFLRTGHSDEVAAWSRRQLTHRTVSLSHVDVSRLPVHFAHVRSLSQTAAMWPILLHRKHCRGRATKSATG